MIDRYSDERVTERCSLMAKRFGWRRVELAVAKGRAKIAPPEEHGAALARFDRMKQELDAKPPDIPLWLALEKEYQHDMNAAVAQDRSCLPLELQSEYHKHMTSFDTEDPEFALLLQDLVSYVLEEARKLDGAVVDLALKYRYTPYVERTHGQFAQRRTFGGHILTWRKQLAFDIAHLMETAKVLRYAKISGATGTYDRISPELERASLAELGLEPFPGATQIMPRELYVPVANAICLLCKTVDKISYDIWLWARSGCPLVQEPFPKLGKGSTAMPGKKNPWKIEREGGMEAMAQGYASMISQTPKTAEGRDIKQSSIERVAWPDLVHVALFTLTNMTVILNKLEVLQDNMLREIVVARGIDVGGAAMEFLAERLAPRGVDPDSAYRMVQLAAFAVLRPSQRSLEIRKTPPKSLAEAASFLAEIENEPPMLRITIREVLANSNITAAPELKISQETIDSWNRTLAGFFADRQNREDWYGLFDLETCVKNEQYLFEAILDK